MRTVPRLAPSRVRAVAVALALLAPLAVAPKGVEKLLRAHDDWPLGSLLVFDLAGIYMERPDLFPGSFIERDVDLAQLRRLYTPDNGAPLFWNAREKDVVDYTRLPRERRAVRAEWLTRVRAAPGAYLRHRWNVFTGQLGIGRPLVVEPFWWDMWPNDWSLALPKAGAAYRTLERVRWETRNSFLFRGWFWLAAATVAGIVGWRRRDREPVVPWVAASGVLYCLPYLVIGVSGDYRYVYWTTMTALVGALLVVSPRASPT